MKRIGITTTVPIEAILAAGNQPVDLNNLFINHREPNSLIAIAENDGFPLNTCAWIKGIYGVVRTHEIDEVVCVTGGDCSNTRILMEVLNFKGVRAIPFSFPDEAEPAKMRKATDRFAEYLGTSLESAETRRLELTPVRYQLKKLDYMTWAESKISGWENYSWLVSSSDFNGDVDRFLAELNSFIKLADERKPFKDTTIRLGLTGVPPIFASGLLTTVEQNNARVVFNEIPRQFSMPYASSSLADQYSTYTYPYSMKNRLSDISEAITDRKIDGIIHYVQSFCHRSIGDILMRHEITVPILTIEGNNDTHISQHLNTRLEAFIDMLQFKNLRGE